MKKMLIVYYSWSNGNTKRIAGMLQEKTEADIVRIDTLETPLNVINQWIEWIVGFLETEVCS